MGVHGLWDLLAPVGRRVSVETLAGKRLAIDASIWMIQFMKAMRDEKGEMIRNAHLVGFFRRICKLLFLRTKPVFVFYGGTPALKRRTVIARRRQRENAQAKVRKTAEKLLLNQLRTMRLKELQEDIRNQRPKNDAKGKKVSFDEQITGEHTSEKSNLSAANYDQEALDAMLAASIAAEEGGSFAADASTSGAGIPQEEEEEEVDDDEEMILPAMQGKIDPAILASLPPSMQLDLLVQMRERLMAENRQRYQKVKKAPARFSELQIQAYLKTVAFRREIDQVQKSAAGKGIGGVQTSRIASEANREFIFSSSFTGDKQVLASGRVEKDTTQQGQAARADISTNPISESTSFPISDCTAESFQEDAGGSLPDDVETYVDERGRRRFNRVRAMGIRMTRDLQRNLDLMKEIEQERVVAGENGNITASTDPKVLDVPGDLPNSNPVSDALDQSNGIADASDIVEDSPSENGNSIKITFEIDAAQKTGDDDDLFAHLVAGEPLMDFSVDNSLRKEQSMDSTSDYEWEDGVVEGKVASLSHDTMMKSSLDAGGTCDDSGVDWEDGSPQIREEAFPCPADCHEPPSKGALEEEAAFQEAIRRSLEDVKDPEIDISFEHNNHKERISSAGAKAGNVNKDGGLGSTNDIYQPLALPSESESKSSILYNEAKLNALSSCDNSVSQCSPDVGVNPSNMELPTESTVERCLKSSKDENTNVILHGQIYENPNAPLGKVVNLVEEKIQDTSTKSSSTSLFEGSCDSSLPDTKKTESEATLDGIYHDTVVPLNMSPKGTASDVDIACKSSQAQAEDELHLESGKSTSVSADNKDEQGQVTEAGLEEQLLFLDAEYKQLGSEQKRLERNAESVSSEMFAECQELLQMFGLPYIIAPMEAEAQCAFMELANLVDGVVTDDSDAFLFGARSVYKNIFDDRKYVETYFMKDIENELGLDREKLIRMALLLGSDYTEGISGIGIVNAVEVMSAFPEDDGLRKFREWIESPDPAILGKLDAGEGSSSKKRGLKVGEIDRKSKSGDVTGDGSLSQSEDETEKMKQIFKEKHRNVSKNWHIPSSFPSEAVISAYASPQVDKSMDPFAWGKPDLFALRKVSWEKFGWGAKKADEVLLPVLKEYEKHETQLRLEAFYTFNERFAKIRSKRIKSTIKGITGSKFSDQIDGSSLDIPKSRKKRRNTLDEEDRAEAEKCSSVMEHGETGVVKMSSKKPSNKRKSQTEAEVSNPEPSREANTRLSASNDSSVKRRGKERGRIQSTGKRKKRTESCLKDAETSSDDGLTDGSAETAEVEFEMPHQVRRSERPRKAVKYSMSDINSDDPDEADESDGAPTVGDAVMKEASADQVIVGDSSSGANKQKELGLEYPGDLLEADGEFGKVNTEPTTEINQSKSGQNDDSPDEAQLSKQYLKMGGGFCLEDEADENFGNSPSIPNQAVFLAKDSAAPAEEENRESDSSQLSANPISGANEQMNERLDANETGDANKTKMMRKDGSSFTGLQEDNDDHRTDTTRPLRAMPNLRRRRKN